jgi:hypothetical protein
MRQDLAGEANVDVFAGGIAEVRPYKPAVRLASKRSGKQANAAVEFLDFAKHTRITASPYIKSRQMAQQDNCADQYAYHRRS